VLKSQHAPARRGLEEALILEIALEDIERNGLEAFSLRSVARRAECDPAALIYRFGSREGLERRVADLLHSHIQAPRTDLSWRAQLSNIAEQYRGLARRYPQAFSLFTRYWTAGPRDRILANGCYEALQQAGLKDAEIPAAECGFYAAVLGLCAAEAGGMMRSPSRETIAEIKAQAGLDAMARLLPQVRGLSADRVFLRTLLILLDGIEAAGQPCPRTKVAPGKDRGAAPQRLTPRTRRTRSA
jgi:AcrR family transcriptional regulator